MSPDNGSPDIYYKYDPTEEPDLPELESQSNTLKVDKSPTLGVQQPVTTSYIPSGPVDEIDDTKVPVSAILMSLVAPKLKKDPRSIPMTGSISNLVGGRPSPVFLCFIMTNSQRPFDSFKRDSWGFACRIS
jgi:fatty acid synthase subunit alpha